MSVGYVPDNTSKSYSHGLQFPVEMRAVPTLTITNAGSNGVKILMMDKRIVVFLVINYREVKHHKLNIILI